MKTSYKECEGCHTRILIVRAVPPLNYHPDPAGSVAVTISDPPTGRFLGHGEQPGTLEHRYSLHETTCTNPPRRPRKPATSPALKHHN